MKDQLISFETAKLARESGFDEECGLNYAQDGEVQTLQYWEGNGNGFESNSEIDCDFYIENNPVCSAPTQSLLQRWLREVHEIEVISYPIIVGSYSFKIYKFTEIINIIYLNGRSVSNKKDNNKSWPNYEEALEEGLQEALKLIK